MSKEKSTFIKHCCFSLSRKRHRVSHPFCEPQRADAKSWTQTEVTEQALRAVRGRSVDTSTRLRLLIPSHSAFPRGRMKNPECEVFFSTYPKAETRCQSLQTAQNQRIQTRKAPHFLLHSISEGQTLCLTTHLSMVSVTSATGRPWVGEKRSPELQVQWDPVKSKVDRDGGRHPITDLWTSHLHLHTCIWVCIHTYTCQTNIHLIIHGKHLFFLHFITYMEGMPCIEVRGPRGSWVWNAGFQDW